MKIIHWNKNETLPLWVTALLTDHRRIYFHETTGRSSLNLRQLCAVESAAKENLNRSIQLFLQSDNVDLRTPLDSIMKQYSNLAVILINATDYFADTVF